MDEEIVIGMGKLVVVNQPAILSGIGLGSCVGLMLYDSVKKVSGMAHIMLPDSQKAKFLETKHTSIIADDEEFTTKTFKNSLIEKEYEISAITNTVEDTLSKFKELSPFLTLISSSFSQDSLNKLLEDIFLINKTANVVIAEKNSKDFYIPYLVKGVIDVITPPIYKKKIDFSLDFVNNQRYFRFADIAINKMLDKMYSFGCSKENIKAKVVGGAHMFSHCQVKIRNIGEENSKKVIEILNDLKVPIVQKVVGGDVGRTVKFNTSDYSVKITSKEGEITL
ncbi:MAG: chemotaxis protein CheD [Candidatus Woesearchaeota archaeon]